MTITESRLKTGVLHLGDATTGVDFACQATNVRLTPSYEDDGDNLETLCGDSIAPGKKETWVLAGTAIQDFDDPLGFVTYCMDNATTTVAFEWTPNTTGAPTFSGNVVIVAVEIGGDVNTRLTTDFEFDVSGPLTVTPPAGGATEAQAQAPAA